MKTVLDYLNLMSMLLLLAELFQTFFSMFFHENVNGTHTKVAAKMSKCCFAATRVLLWCFGWLLDGYLLA